MKDYFNKSEFSNSSHSKEDNKIHSELNYTITKNWYKVVEINDNESNENKSDDQYLKELQNKNNIASKIIKQELEDNLNCEIQSHNQNKTSNVIKESIENIKLSNLSNNTLLNKSIQNYKNRSDFSLNHNLTNSPIIKEIIKPQSDLN
jgi:hypothetical protein